MNSKTFFAWRCGALLAFACSGAAQAVCHVRTDAIGANSGVNWADAYVDLQSALRDVACGEVWVAAGTYRPGGARGDSFVVRPGSAVYGGFAGDESVREARDPAARVTILSGDIGSAGDVADNSYHVVTLDGTTTAGTIDAGTVLDGFTIQGGNASAGFPDNAGGGLRCNGEANGRACSPTLARLRFVGNRAVHGGAVFTRAMGTGTASPDFSDVVFDGNRASGYGGAIYNYANLSGVASPSFRGATFSGNSADRGGAIYSSSGAQGGVANVAIVNATFHGNDASLGSSIGNGGAIYNDGVGGSSGMRLTNVSFSANTANGANHFGGAMVNAGVGARPVIVNAIFWGDQAGGQPEFYNNGGAQPTIASSLIAGGCPFGAVCTDVRDLDPQLGALADNGGVGQTLLPGDASPAIDAGDDANCPAADPRGVPRPQGAQCDIGAVEVVPPHRCYVNGAASGANNGFGWSDAYTDLQAALREPTCNEVWVAQGVYKPTAGTDRAIHFSIRPNLKVHGGFIGDETDAAQADPGTNRTVLSGDIDGNDTVNANGIVLDADQIVGSNTNTVVLMDGTSIAGPIGNDTVLDGFAITGGTGSVFPNWTASAAGGLYCDGQGAGHACSPTLSRLWFSGNRAGWAGALAVDGYSNGSADAIVRGSLFSGNRASSGGGALVIRASSATLAQVTFSSNSAEWGSAVQVEDGNPRIAQSTFSNNVASDAVYGSTVFINGGGPTLDQVILWSNTGADFYRWSGTMTVSNSIVPGGCAAGITCNGLIPGDPWLGPLQDNGGATPTMLPGIGGAAIDAGDPAICGTAPYDADQRGVARPQGPACDIGAVEVRQTQLAAAVAGPGSVTADASAGSTPASGGIAACDEVGGECVAGYASEPTLATVVLDLAPAAHAHLDSVSDICGADGGPIGVLDGLVYTIAPLEADCAVLAVFALDAHTIGGTVSGLAGSGLAVQINGGETLAIATDGTFTFSAALEYGATYAITIASSPTAPWQTCTIEQGEGIVGDADVTDIAVACATNSYAIGGTVDGLDGSGLTLRLNDDEVLPIAANGTFAFVLPLASGSSYAVEVGQMPSGQDCVLDRASGTVGGSDVDDIAVHCAALPPQLVLTIDDDRAFARYGQVVDYTVTLRNDGFSTAVDVPLDATLSGAFDAAFAQWQCFGGEAGAVCTAGGSGALADRVTLPPGRSLTWLVSVPVRSAASEAEATFALALGGDAPRNLADTDTLVLLRDGYDAMYGDGARFVGDEAEALLGGESIRTFALPPPSGGRLDDLMIVRGKFGELRVQRTPLDATVALLRLLRRDVAGREQVSAWVGAPAGVTLVLASVSTEEGARIALLDGAQAPAALPIADDDE